MAENTAVLYAHAFGDETGDAGFKLARGSTPFFVAGLVLTNRPDELREYLSDYREEMRLTKADELSFRRSPDRNRNAFLHGLMGHAMAIRALVVNKALLGKDLRTLGRMEFYAWAFGNLLAHVLDELDAATVVLDEFGHPGAMGRALKRTLTGALSETTFRRHIRRIYPRRSHSEPLLQVADMVTGAIHREASEGDDRFYRIIRPVTKVWRV